MARPSTGAPLGDGTIFELAKGSSTITVLAYFAGSDGETPNGGLLMDMPAISMERLRMGGP